MSSRKTLDQRIEEQEAKLRKLKAQARAEARKERTHRLVASAAKIEAEAGIELDAEWASAIARAIADGSLAKGEARVPQRALRDLATENARLSDALKTVREALPDVLYVSKDNGGLICSSAAYGRAAGAVGLDKELQKR